MMASLRVLGLLLLQLHAATALVMGVRSPRVGLSSSVGLAPLAPTYSVASVPSRSSVPRMGLFGLGAPELAIIAGVALLVLGPDQVKKLAKDVGKVSAELKQVPEEFSKGMEQGKVEMESKKAASTIDSEKKTDA